MLGENAIGARLLSYSSDTGMHGICLAAGELEIVDCLAFGSVVYLLFHTIVSTCFVRIFEAGQKACGRTVCGWQRFISVSAYQQYWVWVTALDAFSGAGSKAEFLSLVDSTYVRRDRLSGFPPLTLHLAISRMNPMEMTTVNAIDHKFSVQIGPEIDDGFFEFTANRSWGGEEASCIGYLLRDGERWIIVDSSENPNLIRGTLYRLQPMVTPLRVYSDDFLKIAKHLSRNLGSVSMEEAFLRRVDQNLGAKKNIVMKQLENYVKSDRRWIQSIRFSASPSTDMPRDKWFDASLDRKGEARLYSGNLSLLVESLIGPAYDIAFETFRYMEEKSAAVAPDTEIEPVTLQFDRVISDDDLDNILTAVKSIENMHYAIAQSGNPFLLLHLLDSLDGSLMDLMAGGNEVCLVPVQKVSPNSYMRVTEAVFDKLNDGALVP